MDRRLREAELAFLNAPFEPGGWLLALQQLAAVTDSALAQLCAAGGPTLLPFSLLSDERHDPHGHLQNPDLYGPENWRVAVTGGPRTIAHERHYAAYRARAVTTYYDDAISDLDLPHGCQSALMMDANGLTGLALLRTSRDGVCTADTLDRFRILARQAHRALRVQIALGEEAAELMVAGPAGRVDATILLDRFCNVLAMTQAAEALFDEPGGLQLAGHQLRLAHPPENRALGMAFARLLASDGVTGPVLHETILGRTSLRQEGRWRAVVVRLGGEGTRFGFEPQLAVTLTPL